MEVCVNCGLVATSTVRVTEDESLPICQSCRDELIQWIAEGAVADPVSAAKVWEDFGL